MKLENRRANDDGFTPIEVVITLETREEFDAILFMSRLNVSIPGLSDHLKRRQKIREFLDGLRGLIEPQE